MKYQWLLFDADDTVFDYHRAMRKALQRTFEQAGVDFQPQYLEVYQAFNVQLWQDFEAGKTSQDDLRIRRFEQTLAALNLPGDAVDFSQRYTRNLSQCADLVDGVEETLPVLDGLYRMAIITNGIPDVQRPRFASSPIMGYFKEVIISGEIGTAKPDISFFDIVFERIGNPPREHVLVIGDSLTSDIQGGNNYDIDTCWFNPNGRSHEEQYQINYEIDHFEALIPLLTS